MRLGCRHTCAVSTGWSDRVRDSDRSSAMRTSSAPIDIEQLSVGSGTTGALKLTPTVRRSGRPQDGPGRRQRPRIQQSDQLLGRMWTDIIYIINIYYIYILGRELDGRNVQALLKGQGRDRQCPSSCPRSVYI